MPARMTISVTTNATRTLYRWASRSIHERYLLMRVIEVNSATPHARVTFPNAGPADPCGAWLDLPARIVAVKLLRHDAG